MFKVKFLGTGGARFVIMRQLRASGGIYVITDEMKIHIDPGPGALVRMLSSRPKLDPTATDAVILTHKHLDHSNDVNVILEALTQGGFYKRGVLFSPADALENDPPVLHFVREYIHEIQVLKEGFVWEKGSLKIEAPLKLKHGVENYAIRLTSSGRQLTLISDTLFFEELIELGKTHVLIAHVLLTEPREGILHLSVPDFKRIIVEAKPQVAIMTHFGMRMIHAKPWVIAEQLSQETGVRVIAARDGMEFDIEKEVQIVEGEKFRLG